ncbi:MarR family transcriptional regulator [Nonomuraea sp. NPDC049684]|uniref:MarR family transcriptional regulator n=1 Tax=Nonomuraea sp. NPDC049684 TaxID=3364356 RepID=UPI00378828E9
MVSARSEPGPTHLGLNSAGTTAVVDRLERLGHVRRERDTRDRRRVLLKVDESAVTLGWSFFGPLIQEIVQLMEGYDTTEQATIERFLNDVHQAVTQSSTGRPSPARTVVSQAQGAHVS